MESSFSTYLHFQVIKALKKLALAFTGAPLDEIHAPTGAVKAGTAEPVKVLW